MIINIYYDVINFKLFYPIIQSYTCYHISTIYLCFFITLLHLSENSSLPIPLLLLGYAKLFYDRDNSFFLPYTSQPIFVKLIVYFLIGIGWSMLKLRLY